ncbi:MAG: alpha/beta hydrolase [Anaerolineae bacterium]|nr:alpha/beta hydrolase [Anaerolineae bacterium]
MTKLLTREQNIKKAKRLRKLQMFTHKLQSLSPTPKSASSRTEVFIDTEFGKVRTLGYGFENPETVPIFFDLHGGGFVMGNADMDEALNMAFNQHVGCKIISIDYAKAPDFPYPAAINQIYAVVDYVYENAEKYAIDPTRMAIGGHSAGGNLSTVTCMKAKKEGKFQFVCQVLDYPPLDLATSALDKPQPKGCIPPRMALMFDACYVDPAQAKDPYVSPIYATQEDLKGLPPALLVLASMDSLHDEGLKYCEMLKTAGVVTECYEYPNALHGFTLSPSADTTNAIEKMVAFLRKYLK